jgi:ABC-type glycerol-3-phosphate transport system permease component
MPRRRQARVVAWAYAILLAGCAFALVPILWALSTSLKDVADATAYPPAWIPPRPTLANYRAVLFSDRYVHYLVNTLLVGAGAVALSLCIAAPAAHGAARGRFAGKDSMLFVLWATIMMPGAAIIVPLYLVTVYVGLYDTYAGLVIVYSAAIVPTLVWLLRGFVQGVSPDLEQAAMIDGCGRWSVFWRITLPLVRPGLIAGAIFAFVTVWNEFLIAFSLTLRDELRTIQVGIYFFITDVGIEWGRMMAAVIASIVPIVALYALLQQRFVEGMTGAIKE